MQTNAPIAHAVLETALEDSGFVWQRDACCWGFSFGWSADDDGRLRLALRTISEQPPAAAVRRQCHAFPAVLLLAPSESLLYTRNATQRLPAAASEAAQLRLIDDWRNAPPPPPSDKACESALLALLEFHAEVFPATAEEEQAPAGPLFAWFRAWLGVEESAADPLETALRRAAVRALSDWQALEDAPQRPAAFLSQVYGRLASRLDASRRRRLGAWFTPAKLADGMARAAWRLLEELSERPAPVWILEPAAGFGTLAEAAALCRPDGWPAPRLTAVEADEDSATVCRLAFGRERGVETLNQDWLQDRDAVEEWIAAFRRMEPKPLLLVIGNPPWSGISKHMNSWVQELIEDYKNGNGAALPERKHWLSDEYVKFFRLAQYLFERTEAEGALAFVSSHSWLDNPTFRGMRERIAAQFETLRVIDLHGSSLKREAVPEGAADENLFGVKQGVCLTFAGRSAHLSRLNQWAEGWGTAQEKIEALADGLEWKPLRPEAPDWLLTPRPVTARHRKPLSCSIADLFQLFGSGVVTARDAFAIADRPEWLLRRVEELRDPRNTDAELRERWQLRDTSSFRLSASRRILRELSEDELAACVQPILYRPFWRRWVFYHDAVVERRVFRLMQHLTRPNLALVTVRRSAAGDPAGYYLAAQGLVSQGAIRADNQSIDYVFPLWRHERPDGLYDEDAPLEPTPNLNREALLLPEYRYGFGLEPEAVFGYLYALCNATGYREAYGAELRADFLRVAWVDEADRFSALSELGLRLARLHAAGLPDDGPPTGAEPPDLNRPRRGRPRASAASAEDDPLSGYQIGAYPIPAYWAKRHLPYLATDAAWVERRRAQLADLVAESLRLQGEIDIIAPLGYWAG